MVNDTHTRRRRRSGEKTAHIYRSQTAMYITSKPVNESYEQNVGD